MILFLLIFICRYLSLLKIQNEYRRRSVERINIKNKERFLNKGLNWHKLRNKNISIILTSFYSGVSKDDKSGKYEIKIRREKSILILIHELAHIKNKDSDGHRNDSLVFALSLAWRYIAIFEPRAINAEIDYFKQQKEFNKKS